MLKEIIYPVTTIHCAKIDDCFPLNFLSPGLIVIEKHNATSEREKKMQFLWGKVDKVWLLLINRTCRPCFSKVRNLCPHLPKYLLNWGEHTTPIHQACVTRYLLSEETSNWTLHIFGDSQIAWYWFFSWMYSPSLRKLLSTDTWQYIYI